MRLLVLAGLLGLSGSALADGVLYPRQQPPPPPLEPAAPAANKPAALAPIEIEPPNPIAEATPRPEQEQILVQLIAQTADSEVEEKADYYFRLATLYSAQQRQALRRLRTATGRDAASAANEAKMYLLKAVKTYKGLTDNDAFRNYPKLDRALFDYGYTLQAGKYMKEARAVYDKLLKNFPDSTFVPFAHLVFGDYYFEQNQLEDAEARYRVVLKFPKSEVYADAMYKIGWTQLERQRWQEALETFFEVARLTANDVKVASLHRAAELGFVEAYAQIGKPDHARAAFERLDHAQTAELLGMLAQRACGTRVEAAHAMASAPANAGAATAIEALVALAASPQADAACKANAAALADQLARQWHHEFAATQSADTLGDAVRAYAAYVTAFPDAADHDEMRAAYAEALWSQAALAPSPERWTSAASVFIAIGSSDALAAGVLAYKNALGAEPPPTADLAAAARDHTRPRAIPAREQQALAALDQYAGSLGDTDAIVDTRLLAAARYRRYGHPERAIDPLADFVEQNPTHASAELAANLVLDSMVRAHRYDDLLVYASDLARDTDFLVGKPALQHNLEIVFDKYRHGRARAR